MRRGDGSVCRRNVEGVNAHDPPDEPERHTVARGKCGLTGRERDAGPGGDTQEACAAVGVEGEDGAVSHRSVEEERSLRTDGT